MPRLTWMKKTPAVNYLAALLREYKRISGLTSEDIAKEMNCTAENVRAQIGKPAEMWSVGHLMRYCDIIGIPYQEAFEAATKSRLPVRETGKRPNPKDATGIIPGRKRNVK